MNHYTWTYVAGEGKNYPVGLLHGAKTGHLLIYVSGKIVVVDFKVFTSKTYTFFINEELCRIRLERRKDEMFYSFEIDRETETPLNVYRRKRDRKYLGQTLLFFGGLLAVVILLVVVYHSFKEKPYEPAVSITQRGQQTVGKVFIKNASPQPEISYSFVANNNAYSAKSSLQPKPLILLENGMPLESGDEFLVYNMPSDPSVSEVDFGKPSSQQIEAYQRRAAEKHLQLHPEQSKALVACLVKIAYELKGIGGLADFYFQDVSARVNPAHNHGTYLELTEELKFEEEVGSVCK